MPALPAALEGINGMGITVLERRVVAIASLPSFVRSGFNAPPEIEAHLAIT